MHLLHYDDYTDKKIIVPNLNEVKNLSAWILVVYALGVMKKATTSSKRKQNSLTKKAKSKRITSKKRLSRKSLVKPTVVLSETKEERKKRLAEKKALTLLAFQMTYDNYHQN